MTDQKVIYFDLVAGSSGDMLLSAFLEAGFKLASLNRLISSLGLKDTKVMLKKVGIGHTQATRIEFLSKSKINLSFSQIASLFKKAKIADSVKEKSLYTYDCLRKVEAKLHGCGHRDFKFQHLGEADALIEISSFWQAKEELAISDCFCSVFPLGCVSPAALELLKNKKVRFVNWGYETVTPTAAALLKDCRQAELDCIPQKIGYGAGLSSSDKRPDFLRLVVAESCTAKEEIIKLEVNLDDLSPQVFDHLMELLFSKGALDVYVTPVMMKKNRPAFVLSVLLKKEDLGSIEEVIFRETTTFGVRYAEFKRDKLRSEFINRNTSLGRIKFRRGYLNGSFIKEAPEYNDCKKAAAKYNIPLIEVYKKLG